MMVRYCSRHRHAWIIADRWSPGQPCPVAPTASQDCEIRTVDAVAKINELGDELRDREGNG